MTIDQRIPRIAVAAVIVMAAAVATLLTRPQGAELVRLQSYGPASDAGVSPGVPIVAGALDQQFLESHPDGTLFTLEAGVHRLASPLRPRSRQTLAGEPGAVLRGSIPVEQWRPEGGAWVAEDQTQELPRVPAIQPDLGIRYCLATSPRCRYPEGVFLDGTELQAVARRDDLRTGSFFLDYARDRLWLADDPTGRLVEATVTAQAVSGGGEDVRITNLVIEQFASATQAPAMVDDDGADGWEITRNRLRAAAGAAVRLSGDAWVLADNDISANGQLGVKGKGVGGLVARNRIAGNNTRGYAHGFESSGAKFTNTTDLVVRANWVAGNDGNGLWTDIDNIGTLYEDNLVEDNTYKGIFHEISYDAVIRDNVISGNGDAAPYWFDGAGITVHNARDVKVTGNVVRDNLTGIAGRQDARRGPGVHGEWTLEGLRVHDNVITHLPRRNSVGVAGHAAGITAHNGAGSRAFAPGINQFLHNTYVLDRASTDSFAWKASVLGWDGWQKAGHDRDGRTRPLSDSRSARPAARPEP